METAENTGTAEAEMGTVLKGRERASATTFSEPGMWTILLVNSAMYAKWRVCLADHGREERNRVKVRGL